MATAKGRRSISKTHERISQLGWEPENFTPTVKYPTRYHFPAKAKDPMKHIMREYLPMELEKDERVYGGHDAGVRSGMPFKVEERWSEILKPFITVTNYAEIGAGRCMSMLMEAVPNNELRNGYHIQFLDELRHTGMQMSLSRWYAKNVPDPAGWNIAANGFAQDSITLGGLNMLSHFIVGDPIQCAFTLQVVAETAFTNAAFVALPDVGARNGDFVLPTTYLSVQSDEARHISNGYATLLTVLQDERNIPHIQRDLQQAWWINHAFLDTFIGGITEYFSRDRTDPESYLDKWDRWIRDDWYRAYVLKLGRLGLEMPTEIFERARERIVNGLIHKTAMFAFASWPLHFWRFDPLDERDFEWFEDKYPGWYDEYGWFWEGYRQMSDPAERGLLLGALLEQSLPMCWTCVLPCHFEEDLVHRVVDNKTRFYCSKECCWLDESNPGRYQGDRNYFDRFHGWGLGDMIRELGFLRSDGHTLMGQPHLSEHDRWTLDDIEATGAQITSPNIAYAQTMGLPSGDWSKANGNGLLLPYGQTA